MNNFPAIGARNPV